MIKGPGSSTVAVGVLYYVSILVFLVTNCVNAPVRYSIGVIQSYFLNVSIVKSTGIYIFCNSENLLFKRDRMRGYSFD